MEKFIVIIMSIYFFLLIKKVIMIQVELETLNALITELNKCNIKQTKIIIKMLGMEE